ncbi:hypothetical protein GLOIN_2v1816381 [Rhizophagus irregularis DAOM 181602=DAOM 197198]|nr:hypothetical protein GLOIN_2v1816381 [Rhizophagus irregularis DAOM 181602=DAOM 197198]
MQDRGPVLQVLGPTGPGPSRTENLELQIKATQEERNRIDTLLNEFLVHDLLEAFEMDNPINHDLFKKNSPPELN